MAFFDNADCLFGASVIAPFVKELGVSFLELPLFAGGLGVSSRGIDLTSTPSRHYHQGKFDRIGHVSRSGRHGMNS